MEKKAMANMTGWVQPRCANFLVMMAFSSRGVWYWLLRKRFMVVMIVVV